jgi:hypothetical protein
MNINDIIFPVLNIIIAAVVGYIGTFLVQAVPEVLAYIEAKLGQANYARVKAVAIDIWNKIEEDCRLGDLTTSKAKAFERLLIANFPELTLEEINLVNKAIAGEVNKDVPQIVNEIQPVAATQTVEQVAAALVTSLQPVAQVAAIIQPKYVAPDGTELIPAQQV